MRPIATAPVPMSAGGTPGGAVAVQAFGFGRQTLVAHRRETGMPPRLCIGQGSGWRRWGGSPVSLRHRTSHFPSSLDHPPLESALGPRKPLPALPLETRTAHPGVRLTKRACWARRTPASCKSPLPTSCDSFLARGLTPHGPHLLPRTTHIWDLLAWDLLDDEGSRIALPCGRRPPFPATSPFPRRSKTARRSVRRGTGTCPRYFSSHPSPDGPWNAEPDLRHAR